MTKGKVETFQIWNFENLGCDNTTCTKINPLKKYKERWYGCATKITVVFVAQNLLVVKHLLNTLFLLLLDLRFHLWLFSIHHQQQNLKTNYFYPQNIYEKCPKTHLQQFRSTLRNCCVCFFYIVFSEHSILRIFELIQWFP